MLKNKCILWLSEDQSKATKNIEAKNPPVMKLECVILVVKRKDLTGFAKLQRIKIVPELFINVVYVEKIPILRIDRSLTSW